MLLHLMCDSIPRYPHEVRRVKQDFRWPVIMDFQLECPPGMELLAWIDAHIRSICTATGYTWFTALVDLKASTYEHLHNVASPCLVAICGVQQPASPRKCQLVGHIHRGCILPRAGIQKSCGSCGSFPSANGRSCNEPLVEDNGLKSTAAIMTRHMHLANNWSM